MAENIFEIETIADKANGILTIKDYDKQCKIVKDLLEENKVFIITTNDDKKKMKQLRADLNSWVKEIDRVRIDTVNDYTADFTSQCNYIRDLLATRAKELGEAIKTYEDSQKLVLASSETSKKGYTATLKFTNEKLIEKIKAFAEKNGCELTIK